MSTGRIALLLALLTLTACVSQAKYDTVARQRDDYRRQFDAAQSTEAVLRADLRASESEKQELQQTYEDLTTILSEYIVAKKITLLAMQSGVHIRMKSEILFPTGSANLNPEGSDLLKQIVPELNEIPFQIVVAGHTDNVPIGPGLREAFPTNWDLAAARAAHVADLLESEGVSNKRMVVVSFGEIQPVADNGTAEGRSQNRRIELRLRPVVPGR